MGQRRDRLPRPRIDLERQRFVERRVEEGGVDGLAQDDELDAATPAAANASRAKAVGTTSSIALQRITQSAGSESVSYIVRPIVPRPAAAARSNPARKFGGTHASGVAWHTTMPDCILRVSPRSYAGSIAS